MSRPVISTFDAASGPARRLFASVPFLSDLSDGEMDTLAWAAVPFELAQGETLFRQGDPADELYVIERGSLSVSVRLPGEAVTELGTVGAGSMVGEMGVMDEGNRSATGSAREPTAGFRIPRAAFQSLWTVHGPGTCRFLHRLITLLADRLRATSERMASIEDDVAVPGLGAPATPEGPALERRAPEWPLEHLNALPFFRDYPRQELAALVADMYEVHVPARRVIFREGDPPTSCYVVVRGAIQVSVEREGEVRKLAVLPPGSIFGELALFQNDTRSATCMARERSVLLELEAPRFEEMLSAESPTAFRFMLAVARLLVRSLRRSDRRHAWLVARRRQRLTVEEGG